MQQVEQELRNLKVDEQSVLALQELGMKLLSIFVFSQSCGRL